jgi:site-specific DNA-methyltransferase (adenine-specific)
VDLIVTSPPYTRVIRYGQFNWIRLWFLGENAKEVDKDLFFSQSLKKYCEFMSDVLKEMRRVLKPDARAVLVIGDVKSRENTKIDNLAKIVWEQCAQPHGFSLAEPICEDVIGDNTKVSKIWGKKRGNATKIDRILILKK